MCWFLHLTGMLFRLSLLSVSTLVLFSVATLSAQRLENIPYMTDAAGEHRGDIYQPRGNGPFPALVFLHGGSWRSGSKREFQQMGADLAQRGYVSFAIDYDLKAGSFPLSWDEARGAVQFLREHAAEYHVDPRRIVIAGTSAGGELAALVALAPGGPASEHGSQVPVAGAVIFNGVFDLCVRAGVIKRYLGGDCASRKDVYNDASPENHIHAGAPPFFVGHGTKDHVVPYRASEIFVDDLRKEGVPVTPYVAEGGPHMYWTKAKYYAQNLAAVAQFLQMTVGKAD